MGPLAMRIDLFLVFVVHTSDIGKTGTLQFCTSHTPKQTDRNHLSDYQVKAPTLEDFKQWIVTQSTIWFACVHSPAIAAIPKIGSSNVSH